MKEISVKIYLVVCLIAVLLVTGCANYRNNTTYNEPHEINQTQTATPKVFDYYSYEVPDVTINHTLLMTFPIVKSPMPYYVYNESEINAYKYNLTLNNLRTAFDVWENTTTGKVKFYRVMQQPREGIIVKLVPNLPKDTIGEASPSFYDEDGYSLVVGGRMEIEPLYGGAENLNLLLHEIGHIMGIGHSKNPHSVMYSWNIYSQVITGDIVQVMDELYRNVPTS